MDISNLRLLGDAGDTYQFEGGNQVQEYEGGQKVTMFSLALDAISEFCIVK